MQIEDQWLYPDGTPRPRHGVGLRWRARWREQGRHKSRSFRTKAAAERWLTKHLATPPAARVQAPTVDVLVDAWKATKAHLAKKTREAAAQAGKTVNARWRGTPADEVQPSEVRLWLAGMSVSESTKRHAYLCLRGALELAVQDGKLARNPCAGIKAPQSGKREPVYMTAQQLRALAEGAGAYAPMIMLMGSTGLRIGEAIGLDVGDVGAKRLRVRPEISKSTSGRDVPVPTSVRALLPLEVDGEPRPSGEPLFLSPAGVRLNARNWRERVFAPAAKKVGREGMDPHELRHTAASLAIAAGADVLVVSRMLGHKSPAVTLGIYGHLFDRNLDDVAARMDEVLAAADGDADGSG